MKGDLQGINSAGKGQEGVEKNILGDKATHQPATIGQEVREQYGRKQAAAAGSEKVASVELSEESIKQAAQKQQELARIQRDHKELARIQRDHMNSLQARVQGLHPEAQDMFKVALDQTRELLSQNKLFDSKQIVHQKTFDLALSALDPTNKVASARSFQELMKNIQIG